MPFKLYSDVVSDAPVLSCDVCGGRILDVWNDKATATPSNNGQTTDVVVHHAKCAATGAVTIPLVNFLRLFIIANRVGDLGSDGKLDRLTVEYPTGKGFEI